MRFRRTIHGAYCPEHSPLSRTAERIRQVGSPGYGHAVLHYRPGTGDSPCRPGVENATLPGSLRSSAVAATDKRRGIASLTTCIVVVLAACSDPKGYWLRVNVLSVEGSDDLLSAGQHHVLGETSRPAGWGVSTTTPRSTCQKSGQERAWCFECRTRPAEGSVTFSRDVLSGPPRYGPASSRPRNRTDCPIPRRPSTGISTGPAWGLRAFAARRAPLRCDHSGGSLRALGEWSPRARRPYETR